jgi:hypothetical protein
MIRNKQLTRGLNFDNVRPQRPGGQSIVPQRRDPTLITQQDRFSGGGGGGGGNGQE